MVDVNLFASLVAALPRHCQLVLVGDIDQLPSVGPGSVLAEVIASGAVDVIRLTRIFRQAESSLIVVNAHRLNRGEMPLLTHPESEPDFFFIERETPEEILATMKTLVRERIPERFRLDPLDEVQVLTPMASGQMLGPVPFSLSRTSISFNPSEVPEVKVPATGS